MRPDRASGMNWAVVPAALQAKACKTADSAVQYLHTRKSPAGGFCFYRWMGIEEPTLRDTWHAVAALGLVGVDVPRRDQVVAFLRGFCITGLGDLYHRTSALVTLGETIEADLLERIAALDASAGLANGHVPTSERLQAALRVVRMQQRFAVLRDRAEVCARVFDMQRDGGWGDKPNLLDTGSALAILDTCDARAIPDDAQAFVDGLQVPAFGFTATRDSTYTPLEVLHAGFSACALLRIPVRHLDDAVRGVLACQSSNGGFARSADALPDIALTHLGLQALVLAGALPASQDR